MMNALDRLNKPAFDIRSLDGLKKDARHASPGSLKAAAQQMEGIFVQMMLKSMRDATIKDDLMSSQSADMFTAMHDQQIAQNIAGSGQLGFANMIVRQLGGESDNFSTSPPAKDPISLPGAGAIPSSNLSRPIIGTTRTTTPASVESTQGVHPFISRLLGPVREVAQKSGLHPQLILAQAALESGWGKYEIPTSDGRPSHNLFGIKATGNWEGKTTEVATTEYINGIKRKMKAVFRVYDSYEHALTDYAKLLTKNPRYAGVARSASPELGAKALLASGYATDPAYAKKLIDIIHKVKGDIQKSVDTYKSDLNTLF